MFIDYYEPSPPYTTGYVAFYSMGVNPQFDNLHISNLGAQQKTYYIYSGDVPIAEYDAGGALLAEYVYANGQRVAKINPDGTMHYYLTDHLGSTRALFGSNWNANYHAYGEVAAQSGSEAENKYGFTGKEKDSGTGLTYLGWRYYDPVLGRWLTLDPAGQGWSPYAYAGNSPVMAVDPDGRFWWIVAAAAIGGGLNLYQNWDQIENPWEGLGYFAVGAASGALSTTGPLGAVAAGALSGGGNATIGGGGSGAILQGTVVGAISGAAGFGTGQWAAKSLGGVVINGFQIGSPIAKGIVGGVIGGGVGGYAGGFAGGLITTGSFSQAHAGALSGFYSGATIGGLMGGIGGYKYARDNDLSPWSGRPDRSVVIGEDQFVRVDLAARDLATEPLMPNWPRNDFYGDPLAAKQFNAQWVDIRMQENHYFYDIGPRGNSITSPFYRMELAKTLHYPRTYRAYHFPSLRTFRVYFYR